MKNLKVTLDFIKPLDGWLSSHEGYFLYESAKNTTGKGEILEIGSWKGKSTICLALGSLKKQIFAVDPHKGEYSKGKGIGKDAPTYKEFMNNLKVAGVQERVVPLIATSEDAAKKWRKPIKLLFIDGLHDYQHTKQDYDMWSPFVEENGIIAFHDAFCGHDGPERVVSEEIFTSLNFQEIGVVGSIIYARKGKPNILQALGIFRTKFFISLALSLNKGNFLFKFFVIHRLIKILLLNRYTYHLLFEKI